MATLLYRLGKTAYRRWPVFIAAWLVALIGVATLAGTVSKPMVDTFSIPGIPSLKAQDLQKELFADTANAEDQAGVTVVVAAPEGHTLREPAYAAKVDALVVDLQALPQMPKVQLANPVQAADAQYDQAMAAAQKSGKPTATAEADAKALLPLDESGRVGTISWTYDVGSVADVKPATQEQLLDVLDTARDGGLTAEANGSGMQAMVEAGGKSELIGIGIALVVLIITFGSLVAAGLPILAALVGVGLGVLGISIATAFTTVGTTTPILATMIGLAVGIDYTLFILSRYRTELHHTDDREEAVGRAVGTAGSAVVFAGLTVLIALSALSIVGIPFLTSMGLAAAGTVFMAVLVALTLLPAILGVLKSKAFGGSVRRTKVTRDADGQILNGGVRWARLLGRAPVAVAMLVVVGLGALAVPISGLHLALPSDSTAAVDTTQRKASDLISDAFGPGREAPLLLVIDGRDAVAADRGAAYDDVVAWAAAKPDVANVQIVGMNEAGTGAQILITPRSGPDAQSTRRPAQRAPRRPVVDRAGHGHDRRRHRAHRDPDRCVRPADRRAADLPRGGHRTGVPAAHGGLPLDPGAVDRDARLPALRAGHARRDRPGVPGRPVRAGRGTTARQLHADHRDRDRVRPGDGLPGVPGDPHA